MRPTAKSALATTQTKSVGALGPRICNPTENVQSWHLKNYSALPCKFHSYGENKSNKRTPPFLLLPIRTTVERSLRAHTYHTPGGTRSGNHLSSCELSICKVAPGKHHMSCALVQCSPTNAEVRASAQIPEKNTIYGNQVCIKTQCSQKNSCLSQSMREPALLYDAGYKFWEIKWFWHKYLSDWMISGFEGVLVQRNIIIDLGDKGGILGWNSKNNNTNPVGWEEFSGNTCLQLSHIRAFWEHNIQLGNCLSKKCLLPLIKGNVFTAF